MHGEALSFKKEKEQPQNYIDLAYAKAVEVLEDPAEKPIDPRDFIEYDKDMVKEDLDRVAEMERRFEKEDAPGSDRAKRSALVLETIIHDQVELSDWFGPEAMTRKASRYDDIFNGVDSIAEFKKETGRSYLALGLDVTHGSKLQRKFRRIKDEIDGGKLAHIKYFESADETFRGSLFRVPRMVIGAEERKIEHLAKLWVEGKKQDLAADPIQMQILEEINIQLLAFSAYAKRNGQPQMADIYEKSLKLIQSIINRPDKRDFRHRNHAAGIMSDRVFLEIRRLSDLMSQM